MGGLLAILARNSWAETWSMEPQLGGSADFDSNPDLRSTDPHSEEHVAALFNLPLRYDVDGFAASLSPSGRISNSRGYASLASNYLHFDANAQFTDELNVTSLGAQLARDSSLYHAGELVNGVGVRRDMAAASGDWVHSITDRAQIELAASWSRVTYDQLSSAALSDYRYVTAGPTFSYRLSERNTLNVQGNYGIYHSLDGITESQSENLQLGLVRKLTEVWSLSANAGYSRSANSEKIFFGPFYLGTVSSNQTGAVYTVNLSRQGEQLNLSGEVSRALKPSGFAYLSREDSVRVKESYKYSERWNLSLSTNWQRLENPLTGGGNSDVRYLYVQLTADWNWTPQWVISLHATRITQQYGSPAISGVSNGVSIDVMRQFLRIEL